MGGRELPPRTRRIRRDLIDVVHNSGTTSAYAENTSRKCRKRNSIQNYLRVRGEYPSGVAANNGWVGTTSAYAENTLNELGLL